MHYSLKRIHFQEIIKTLKVQFHSKLKICNRSADDHPPPDPGGRWLSIWLRARPYLRTQFLQKIDTFESIMDCAWSIVVQQPKSAMLQWLLQWLQRMSACLLLSCPSPPPWAESKAGCWGHGVHWRPVPRGPFSHNETKAAPLPLVLQLRKDKEILSAAVLEKVIWVGMIFRRLCISPSNQDLARGVWVAGPGQG